MKIKSRFYYHDKGKHFEYGGYLLIQNRLIIELGNIPVESNGRSFYYDDTTFDITYESASIKARVGINRIITESAYQKSQKEYLTRLNWFQGQKLLWMFRRHWLQRPNNVVHLAIVMLIISGAFLGFRLLTHGF